MRVLGISLQCHPYWMAWKSTVSVVVSLATASLADLRRFEYESVSLRIAKRPCRIDGGSDNLRVSLVYQTDDKRYAVLEADIRASAVQMTFCFDDMADCHRSVICWSAGIW